MYEEEYDDKGEPQVQDSEVELKCGHVEFEEAGNADTCDAEESDGKESESEIDLDFVIETHTIPNTSYNKDIGVITGCTITLAVMIYLIVIILGLTSPSKPLVVAKGASKPFFLGRQRRLIEDSFDGNIRLAKNQTMSVILLYSPYSLKSKQFREEYYQAARHMKKLQGDFSPHFGATNCFDTSSYCRQKYNLKQYPALMAQNSALMGSVYNGPMNWLYVTRWLNRLQNAVYRLQSSEDLINLTRNHDLIVILYFTIRNPPNPFQSVSNFTKLAFHYLDGDPNTERTIFCMVTDAQLAAQFQLHNEHDVVLVSSELKLLNTHQKGWDLETLYDDVVRFSNRAIENGVEFLNLGKRASSTQLAEKIDKGSVLLYFTQDIVFGAEKYQMLKQTARDYLTCPDQHNYITVESIPVENVVDDCSVNVKSQFCGTNTTLSFMMIDSRVESQLATKLGADKNDMVVAINAKQEITRFIRDNVTRENINCLIRQHHNTAENEFVSESSRIFPKEESVYQDTRPDDGVGEASEINFVENISDLMASKKINVILFSAGIWHSSSSSALAPFHLLAHQFKESRSLIDFSIVDVSRTYVPYNLNFEKLPRILITSAESVGLSWTYPEDLMINHTNIARFVLTRPGKIFGRLRWLEMCQGHCRKQAKWEVRSQRLRMHRQLSRNVSNKMRQRAMIGYFDRMLRMMG